MKVEVIVKEYQDDGVIHSVVQELDVDEDTACDIVNTVREVVHHRGDSSALCFGCRRTATNRYGLDDDA